MSVLLGGDPFVCALIQALGVPTRNLKNFVLRSDPDKLVTIEATFYAETSDGEEQIRTFELHRQAALEGALAELQSGAIRALQLEPGDVLVLRFPIDLSEEQSRQLRELMEHHFPGHRAIVLPSGGELQVAQAAQALPCKFFPDDACHCGHAANVPSDCV